MLVNVILRRFSSLAIKSDATPTTLQHQWNSVTAVLNVIVIVSSVAYEIWNPCCNCILFSL